MSNVERTPGPVVPREPHEADGPQIGCTGANDAGQSHCRGAPHLAIGAALLLCAALAVGFWQHYALHAQVMATAEQRRDFVPSVRTAAVRASVQQISVTWPGTTEAFEQANLYARASGYISKRDGRHRQPRQSG